MNAKLCECGCGLPAAIAPKTRHGRGVVKGRPMRFHNRRHAQRGPNNPRWRGGRMDKLPYIMILQPEHPAAHRGYVYEHRLVAEGALGRHLPPGTVVHHVNGDGTDNRSTNLVVCEGHSYHQFLHQQMARRARRR